MKLLLWVLLFAAGAAVIWYGTVELIKALDLIP